MKLKFTLIALLITLFAVLPVMAQDSAPWVISPEPLVDEPVTLRIVAQKAGPLTPNFDEMVIFDWAEAQTNVGVEWTNIANADYQERKNLILASGDLPDAFWNTGFSDYDIVTYGSNGTLVPLQDLIAEHAPNINAAFERYPALKAAATAPDGNIYTIPSMIQMGPGSGIGAVRFFHAINKTWLDNLGLEVPTTLDEYKDVLIAFKTQDPNGNGLADEIPFSFMFDWWCADIGDLFGAFGMPDTIADYEHIIVRDGQAIYTAVQPEYKEAIAYFQTWAAEGLIDPESFTQDVQTYLAKGRAGDESQLGSYIWWEVEEVVGPERADEYVLLPPMEGPTGIKGVGHANGSGFGRAAFAITSANQMPELTMQWIDLFYEPYVTAQVIWGPVGVIYELDENGQLVNLPLPEGVSMGELRQTVAPEGVGVIFNEDFGRVVDMEPRAKQRIEDLSEVYLPYAEDEFYPTVFFTPEELEDLEIIQFDINEYTNLKRAQWLSGGGIEAEWDAYVAQLDAMGLGHMMEIYQAALDRYLAAQ
jgi:putative aldouronate transport system substrate-binding protein